MSPLFALRWRMSVNTFTDLYTKMMGGRPMLGPFLAGHLAVEYMLRRIIVIYNPALANLADDLNHARLISLNVDIGAINSAQRDVLVAINRMRNKLSHQISYEPTLAELRALFVNAASAFSDMTDGIEQGIGEIDAAAQLSDLEEYVISELFAQICYDLHSAYHELGGDMEDF